MEERTRVIVVEDDDTLREVLRSGLEEHYEVSDCAYPVEAMKLLNRSRFDVAILDIDFGPDSMTGLNFIKYVKEANPQTLTIMLTNQSEKMRESIKKEADEFHVKDFIEGHMVETLTNMIEVNLERRKRVQGQTDRKIKAIYAEYERERKKYEKDIEKLATARERLKKNKSKEEELKGIIDKYKGWLRETQRTAVKHTESEVARKTESLKQSLRTAKRYHQAFSGDDWKYRAKKEFAIEGNCRVNCILICLEIEDVTNRLYKGPRPEINFIVQTVNWICGHYKLRNEEREMLEQARKVRNKLFHEGRKASLKDMEMFVDVLSLYRRLHKTGK